MQTVIEFNYYMFNLTTPVKFSRVTHLILNLNYYLFSSFRHENKDLGLLIKTFLKSKFTSPWLTASSLLSWLVKMFSGDVLGFIIHVLDSR